ncbi:hypothetical protein KSF_046530 [Reticulibacter mediterranei]|uniref:DUF2267 domain-containing protein n=1 Tax=Reticulibacter mediterranei TaxID=2778369 RepID=A0A8J3IPN4_9CHLR|nr:DUF2267 domain-containing protein [Reticulibacter mediterranei]GHO94605.1 hypothetical protein KSF_046530 [Reticulibacter mediterranei]
MKYEEFIEQVQKRAPLASQDEARRATRATLETLAECLSKEERHDAASQLPRGLAMYLQQPFLGPEKQPSPSRKKDFSLDDFFERMSIREDMPKNTAREHARVVMSVLSDALSCGELEDIRAELPIEFYYEFFERK